MRTMFVTFAVDKKAVAAACIKDLGLDVQGVCFWHAFEFAMNNLSVFGISDRAMCYVNKEKNEIAIAFDVDESFFFDVTNATFANELFRRRALEDAVLAKLDDLADVGIHVSPGYVPVMLSSSEVSDVVSYVASLSAGGH